MNAVFKGELPHPIIFLFDVDNDDALVPEYEAGCFVQCNDHVISIPTIAYVDGPVHIEVGDLQDDDLSGLEAIGTFSIQCPHEKLDINSSEQDSLATYELGSKVAVLSVFVDTPGYAAVIKVRVARPA